MGMVSWFGVSVASSERLVDALIRSGVKTFAIINFGKGLLVGVDARAEEFVEALSGSGGRATPLSGVELPPARPLRLHAYPVDYALAPRAGVIARRVGAQRFISALYRAWDLKPPRGYEDYVFSATRYGVVFKCFVFSFHARGSSKLSRMILKLKVPLPVRLAWASSLAALTPLDLVNLTRSLVEGGAYVPKSRFAEVVEGAGVVEVPVSNAVTLRIRPGEDGNMLIIGAPGTGKSLLVDHMLESARGDVNIVVLDPTGEHAARLAPPPPYESGWRVLVAGKDYMLNPVLLPNAYDVIAGAITELWREEALTPMQSSFLQRALESSRTLLDVVQSVERIMKSSGREDEASAASALLNRLRPLVHPALLGSSPVPEGRVVLDLGWIDTEEARRAFVLAFLYSVYGLAVRGEWSGIIVVDETDRYACGAMDRIADELRKYGVSIWAVGHSVGRIPPRLLDARYKLLFATSDPGNLNAYRSFLPREVVESIPYLQFGQAVLFERGRAPMVVSVSLPSRTWWYVRERGPTIREVAARRGMSAEELAVEYVRNLDIRDLVVRAARKETSREEWEVVTKRIPDPKLRHALAELYGGFRGGTREAG